MPGKFRQEKINSLIKDFAGHFIGQTIGGGVFATVIKVETSNDFKEATLYLSVFPEEKGAEVEAKLKKKLGDLRVQLSEKGGLVNAPHLDIKIDKIDIAQ